MPAGKEALFREFLRQLNASNSEDEVSSQQYLDMYYDDLPKGAAVRLQFKFKLKNCMQKCPSFESGNSTR